MARRNNQLVKANRTSISFLLVTFGSACSGDHSDAGNNDASSLTPQDKMKFGSKSSFKGKTYG